MTTRPLPVINASFTPSYPKMVPPVGKSGALMIWINSSILMSWLSIYLIVPLTTSDKLCGGILVAIPTAIPEAPLINKLGTRVGNTVGSLSVSSKFSW